MIGKEKRGNKNMNKKEIKDYLKRVDDLEARLMGEDRETFTWLIYGYNQCAKLLNETEQQCKKQKETIDKAIEYIEKCLKQTPTENREKADDRLDIEYKYILDILKKEK